MQAVNTGISASNIGSQALGDGNAINSVYNQGNANAGNYLSGASNSVSAAGNLINSGYASNLAGWNAQTQANQAQSDGLWSGLGTMAGIASMIPFAEGGDVGNVVDAAGEVDGPGGPKGDAIPAALSDGEWVIPAEVVKYKGTEFFDKLINTTHEKLGIPPEVGQMQNGVPTAGNVEGVK